MSKNKIISYENPVGIVEDQLTDFLREAATKMLKVAIEEEVAYFIKKHSTSTTENGQSRIVRNGYLPEREIHSGIGKIKVKMPRIRDRKSKNNNEAIKFSSNLVPKYMRRTLTLDVMLPILYLKGVSTNNFNSILSPLLGDNAKNISPSVVSKLKSTWLKDYNNWLKRDLSKKRYVYWWVDGVYLSARMENEKTCMLVIVGADETGKKELVALVDGFRESKESWSNLLRDLRDRGLKDGPNLAIGDGSLGFWGAITEMYPETKKQRCWVHKTANVLDKLPKSQQAKAKSMLKDIYLSATKKDAQKAYNKFCKTYEKKYPKVVDCLNKDKVELLEFYNFPAEHWQHIRTTNPIESTFATVKHRTRQSRGCFSRDTIVASVFKLLLEAEKRWARLRGYQRLADVINLIQFVDGVAANDAQNKENNLKAA